MEQNQIRINYKDKKLMSATETDELVVQSCIEESNLQWLADKSKTTQSLNIKKRELTEAKSTFPLDCVKIVKLTEEVEALNAGIECLNKLGEELGFKNLDK